MDEQRKLSDAQSFDEWRSFMKAACHPLSPALYTLFCQARLDLYNTLSGSSSWAGICDHKWRMFEDVGPRCVKCHQYRFEGDLE
jgi:hypothetical protein